MLNNHHAVDWNHHLLLLVDGTPAKSPLRFKQIHALFLTTGLALHSLPFSRLLLLSSSLDGDLSGDGDGDLSYSSSLLLHSPRPPSTFLSNTLISSLAASGRHLLALSLLSTVHPSPNSHTYPPLLKACSSSPLLLPAGLALHSRLLKTLTSPLDPFVLTSLIALHSRRRRRACRHLFDQIPNPDLPAWNAILSSSAATDVLPLFQTLQRRSSPNQITLLSLIAACGDLAALPQGIWAHAYINRRRILNRFIGAALIDMYSKSGRLDLARQVFAELPLRDTFCYNSNSMMRGLAAHGDGPGALALFDDIRRERIPPDDVTFLLAMSACSHAGLIEDGRRCFDGMEKEFGIPPKLPHYGCLVDILGRSGQLEDAEEVVRKMPMAPNGALLRSLLGACRIHNQFQIDEEMASKLMELDPDHGGNYVLLSNICSDLGRWDGVAALRKKMKERGVGKNPGLSSVEINGVVEDFTIGDQTHPKMDQIYEMVHQISRRFHE